MIGVNELRPATRNPTTVSALRHCPNRDFLI